MSICSDNGSAGSKSSIATSRASDLQRLVDETEEQDGREQKYDGKQRLQRSDMENKLVTIHCETVPVLEHLPQSLKMALVVGGWEIRGNDRCVSGC